MPHRRARTMEDERALLDRVAQYPEYQCWIDLTAETLRRIAVEEGIDFATALLYDRVSRSRDHGPFIERLNALRQAKCEPKRALNATLAIAPGAFYKEFPHTDPSTAALRCRAG